MQLNPPSVEPDPILSAPLAEQEAWWQRISQQVWRRSEPFTSTVAAVLRNLAGNPGPEAVDALVQQAASAGKWDNLQRLLDARLLEARHIDPLWDAYRTGGEDPRGERLQIIAHLPSASGIDRILSDLSDCVERSGRYWALSILGRARHAAAAQAVLDHLATTVTDDDKLIWSHLRLPAEGAEALLAAVERLPGGDRWAYALATNLIEDGSALEPSGRFLPYWRTLIGNLAAEMSSTDTSDDEWPDNSNFMLQLFYHAGELFPTGILEREVHWALSLFPIPEAVNAAVGTLVKRGLPIDGIDLTEAATNPFTRPGLWSVLAEAGLSALFPAHIWTITGSAVAKVAHALDQERRIRIPPAEIEPLWLRPFVELGHDGIAGSVALLRWRGDPSAAWSLAAVGPFSDEPRLPDDLDAELAELPETPENITDVVDELGTRLSAAAAAPVRTIPASSAERSRLVTLIGSKPGPERDLALPAAVEALLDAVRSNPSSAAQLETLTHIPDLALLDDCVGPSDLLLELAAENGGLTLTMLNRWRMQRDWKRMRRVAEDWTQQIHQRRGLGDRRQGPEGFLGIMATYLATRIATSEPMVAHRLLDAARRRIGAEGPLPDYGNVRRYLTLADAAAEQPEAIRHRLADILETEEYVPHGDDVAFIAWYRTLEIDRPLRLYTRYTVPGLERAANALPAPLSAVSQSPTPPAGQPPASAVPRKPRLPEPPTPTPPSGSPRLLVIFIIVAVIIIAAGILASVAPPGR